MAIFGSAEGTSRALADLGQMQNQKFTGLLIEQTQQELARQATFQRALEQGGVSETPQAELQQVANAQIKSGLVNEGVNTLYKLGLYNSMQVNQQAAKQRQALAQLKYETQLLSGVNSPEDWERAKMVYQGQGLQLPPELANMPYSPEMVKYFKNAAQTEYQKQMEALRAMTETRLQTNADLNNQIRSIELDNLRKGLPKESSKSTGKRIPSPSFIKEAGNVLGTVFNASLIPEAEFADVSQAVADDAMELMAANPGLKSGEALHQALLKQQRITATWPKKTEKAGTVKPEADSSGAFYKKFQLPPLPEEGDDTSTDEGSY
jgi:hypothetical protein